LPPGHRHIAHAQIGATSKEDVLYRGHEAISVVAGAPGAQRSELGAFAFVRMGIEHILTGYDHLVFLFGLLVVGGRVRSLVGVVTAFTIAHSITLALAVLGVWTPPTRVVEAGIALSIVYVGVENFFVTSADRRWRVTFPFGLVHGFGFASALRAVSLSRAQIPIALVSFNVGVEIGQLSVMAVLLPAIVLCKRRGWLDRRATLALSGAVAVAGAVWFVRRALF
jgi:hydrogenase/urease accessory protein HupE